MKQEIAVIDSNNIIRSGYTYETLKTDKTGLVKIFKNGEGLKINPNRIFKANIEASFVIEKDGNKFSKCPKCLELIELSNGPICKDHGQFNTIEQEKKVANKYINPGGMLLIDCNSVASKYELWVTEPIKFGQQDTRSCCVIFEQSRQYIMFNIYGNSFGKKCSKSPIDKFLDGEKEGYKYDDILELRSRLSGKGYSAYSKF